MAGKLPKSTRRVRINMRNDEIAALRKARGYTLTGVRKAYMDIRINQHGEPVHYLPTHARRVLEQNSLLGIRSR